MVILMQFSSACCCIVYGFVYLNLMILDTGQEDQRFRTEWLQLFPELNLCVTMS
jgi:hypothetical protein